MNKHHAIAILAISAAFSLSALAVPQLDEITPAAFPDADAVMVDSKDTYEVRPDGTYKNESEQWVKVLTEKGRREESVIEFGYNARYATARVVSVSVVGVDGVEREVDVSATTSESTDNSSANENIYDPYQRQVVCTVPGVKVGETLHIKTEKDVKMARVEKNYSDLFIFEWTCPILKSSARVHMPKELPLKSIGIRNPLGNLVSSKTEQPDGSVVYEWAVTNSPQAFAEPDTPPIYTQLQSVRVSTASDWPEISRWYWNLSVPHLEKTNPAITNKVEEIVAQCGDGDRISAIYKWVAQEIRYMGLTMEDTSPGYAPHDVFITFDNRYGVCRDKAALLATMLRIAGFEAFPVLIHSGAKMDAEVPLPYFNHAIVAVRDASHPLANKDGFVLMDPTDESSRDIFPSYLCGKSYLVATPEGEGLHLSQIVPPEANSVKIDSVATLDADGSLLLESTVALNGINDNVYRGNFLGRKPDERRKFVEKIVRGAAPGAEILSLSIEPQNLQDTMQPLRLRFTSKVPEVLLRGETLDEFSPPLFSRSFGIANFLLRGSTSLEKRRFPLIIPSTAMAEERLVVKHCGNLGRAAVIPDDVSVGDGGYLFTRSFKSDAEETVVTRKIAIGAVEFSPEEYAELRENMKRVEAVERERPFFSKNSDRDADVRYRLLKTDCEVDNPFSWTITNTVEKEILTYDGKKSSAELTFSWNPLWQDLELVYATVSNRNGQVYSVSEKEMNEFDCSWAAAAPRYPASKQLVVNLPSVEVGSVISYKIVTKVTNAPFAFYKTFFYDVFEPTDVLEQHCIRNTGPHTVESLEGTRTNPKVLKRETMQPDGRLWRECDTVSLGNFKSLAKRLSKACDVKSVEFDEAKDLQSIRDWMYRHVRLVGPSLFEIPLEKQLTDPEVVLTERYATRLDYIRTLTALLRGAGYEADVVFAAADEDIDPALREDLLTINPDEQIFAHALCRVKVKTGGFLGFFADETTYFIGHENEYTPLGASIFDGCDYLDPKSGKIAKVTIPDENLGEYFYKKYVISVRENGGADIDVVETICGPEVGSFRKRYAEMLPEDRSRHYQELLGSISQAATATGDLVTDIDSYPAERRFSCFVPNYATVEKDTITLSLPEIGAHVFPLTGAKRETPMALGARKKAFFLIEYKFPEGYETVEHMPDTLVIESAPTDGEVWYMYAFNGSDDGEFYAVRETCSRPDAVISPIWFDYLKSIDARVTSRANRTVTVRKTK